MIVTCGKCNTGYELEASAISVGGRLVKCSECGNIWRQFRPESEAPPGMGESAFGKSTRNSNLPMAAKSPAVITIGFFPKFLFALLLILNLGAGLLAFSDDILMHYPRLEKKIRVYSARGVEFHEVKYQREIADGKAMLLM